MTELPDEIRVPLHELQADADYLFGRVAADSSCAAAMAMSVKQKLAQVETAIRALSASRPAAEVERLNAATVEWQPIETAPKDETHFLAFDKNSGQYECWWFVSPRHDEAYWMNVSDNEPSPTHWRPLPAPPANPNANEGANGDAG